MSTCRYGHTHLTSVCERGYCLECFCQGGEGCSSEHLNTWKGCLRNESHKKKRNCCKRGYCLGCPCFSESCCEGHKTGDAPPGRPSKNATSIANPSSTNTVVTRTQPARLARPVDVDFNEGHVKRARAVDFGAIANALEVKIPESYMRTSGFSEEVLLHGSVAMKNAAYSISSTLMNGVANAACAENPNIVKAIITHDWIESGVPLYAATQFSSLIQNVADLATRSPDLAIRRAMVALLYHTLSRDQTGIELSQARERLLNDDAASVALTQAEEDGTLLGAKHGIGPKSQRLACRDFEAMMQLKPLTNQTRKTRLQIEQLELWKAFCIDMLDGLRPSRLKAKVRVGNKVLISNMPYFIRTGSIKSLFSCYKIWCENRNVTHKQRLGAHTFQQLITAVSKVSQKEKSVSYFLTDFLDSTALAYKLINRIQELFSKSFAPDEGTVSSSDHSPNCASSDDEIVSVHDHDDDLDAAAGPSAQYHATALEIDDDENSDDEPQETEFNEPEPQEQTLISDIAVDITDPLEMRSRLEQLSNELRVVVHNCKHHFQQVVRCNGQCDGESAHCGRYSLGGECKLDDGSSRVHQLKCNICKSVLSYGQTFHQSLQNAVVLILRKEKDQGEFSVNGKFGIELRSIVSAAKRVSDEIRAYCGHKVRAVWQDHFTKKVLNSITESDAFVIIDYKMKILPMYFQENQKKYFGKQGNSLLGGLVYTRKNGGGIQMSFVDLVLDDNSQDAWCVQPCLFELVRLVCSQFASVCNIHVQSDNAGNFNTRNHLEFIYQMNICKWFVEGDRNVNIRRWIFTEPQCGKSLLDAHFSFVMIVLNNYVDAGNDAGSPDDIFKALSHGAIQNTSTQLVKLSKAPPKSSKEKLKAFPIPGSRSTSDIIFGDNGVVDVFEQSGIGRTSILMTSNALSKWRKSYTAAGYDFLRAKDTEILKSSICNSSRERAVGGDEGSLPEVSVRFCEDATERDILIGNFLKEFTSSQALQFSEKLVSLTNGIADRATVKIDRGWATTKCTKLAALPLPRFVVTKLNELFDTGRNAHKVQPSVARNAILLLPEAKYSWEVEMVVTEDRIRQYFSSKKQKEKTAAKAHTTSTISQNQNL